MGGGRERGGPGAPEGEAVGKGHDDAAGDGRIDPLGVCGPARVSDCGAPPARTYARRSDGPLPPPSLRSYSDARGLAARPAFRAHRGGPSRRRAGRRQCRGSRRGHSCQSRTGTRTDARHRRQQKVRRRRRRRRRRSEVSTRWCGRCG